MMFIASVMIEHTIPATAIPVEAPTVFCFFIAIMPRMRPTTAVAKPAKGRMRDTIPKTIEAIAIPLPGS